MSKSAYSTGYNSMIVDSRFAITLADNGKTTDAATWLKAAPSRDQGGMVAIYITTNGDPFQVVSLDEDNSVAWYADDLVGEYDEPLVVVAARDYGYIGDDADDAAEFLAELFRAEVED